ncbi:hypothetical protein MFRU_031g00850 [Monilinia fructicola]|nr:hypothetical protein MFRU_031g00850 [Monilinia fructicola]
MSRAHFPLNPYDIRTIDSQSVRRENWTIEETCAPEAGLRNLYPLAWLLFVLAVSVAGRGLVEGVFAHFWMCVRGGRLDAAADGAGKLANWQAGEETGMMRQAGVGCV